MKPKKTPDPQKQTPDIPTGLGMSLSQSNEAMSYYGSLSNEKKTNIIQYIQSSTTGAEAKDRIHQTVQMLKEHQSGMF